MEILRGSPALSASRTNRLLTTCLKKNITIKSIYAEYVHFVDLISPLSDDEQLTLNKLLHYGPKADQQEISGQLFLVTPRVGTISPWSSKATDIAHNCGLTKIRRIERGIAYYLDSNELSQIAKADFIRG